MKNEFKKTQRGAAEDRKYEQLLADNEQLKADIEYISMMADIELDEEKEEQE